MSGEMQGLLSFSVELTSVRLSGPPNSESVLSRIATQMSWPPWPSGRAEAKYSVAVRGDAGREVALGRVDLR